MAGIEGLDVSSVSTTGMSPRWYEDRLNVVTGVALAILVGILIHAVTKQLMQSRVTRGTTALVVICVAIQVLRGKYSAIADIMPPEGSRAERIQWALKQLQTHLESASLEEDGSFSVKFKGEKHANDKDLNIGGWQSLLTRKLKGVINYEQGSIRLTEGEVKLRWCGVSFTSIHGMHLDGNNIVLKNSTVGVDYQWPLELSEKESPPPDPKNPEGSCLEGDDGDYLLVETDQ